MYQGSFTLMNLRNILCCRLIATSNLRKPHWKSWIWQTQALHSTSSHSSSSFSHWGSRHSSSCGGSWCRPVKKTLSYVSYVSWLPTRSRRKLFAKVVGVVRTGQCLQKNCAENFFQHLPGCQHKVIRFNLKKSSMSTEVICDDSKSYNYLS